MKQFIIALLLVASLGGLVMLSSCHFFGAKGNGNVTTETRHAEPFTKLKVEGTFPVVLSQDGGAEWVKVETDENLQNLIIVENSNGQISITMEEKPSIKSKEMKVYVNVKNLRELDYESVGSLTTADTLKLDSLEIQSNAVGKLNLTIDAKYLRANLDNVGSTTLKGKVHEARINTESVGGLKAFGLKADHLMLHNKAIGAAEIYADSTFRIRSSAVGSVSYKGAGEVLELSNEGVGKVKRIQ